ncbi:MAG: SpoIIE family protein phosphatase [Bacteroidota bacterium]
MNSLIKQILKKQRGRINNRRLLTNFIGITSLFSVFYILISLCIGFLPGVIVMSVNFLLFLLNLRLFTTRIISYDVAAHIYIANCTFVAILMCSFFSGGLFSPVLPWFILIPTISLLLLGIGRNTFVWLCITIAIIITIGALASAGFEYPVDYDVTWSRFFTTTCIFGLSLIVYIVTMVFEKARENALNKLAQKNKEITDSIYYAQKIQHSLLAPQELIDKYLPNNFIVFKPKDIVSGDFYWAREYNGDFYLAICDCTGHGVPGAFMSLLITSFLNEAITEKSIISPDKILEFIRARIIETTAKSGSQDGMDGVVIRFHKHSGKITYSSGNSFQTQIQNNILTKLPKDKMPVGISYKMEPFTLQTIEVAKGDMLYFYTDGYADLFGGSKGKKFTNKQLNETFLKISSLDMNEQKENLEQTFVDWKGDLEQIDDVCIVGIRF